MRVGRVLFLVVLLVAGGTYSFLRAPALHLETVTVEGLRLIDAEEIREILDLTGGVHLYALSLGEIARQIERDPRVEEASIERVLPGELRIAVVEREPVAIVLRGGVFARLDEHGRVISVEDSWPGGALPLISGYPLESIALGEAALDPDCHSLVVAVTLEHLGDEVAEIRRGNVGPVVVTAEGGELWLPGAREDLLRALDRIVNAGIGLPAEDCVDDYRLPDWPVRRCP